MTRIALIRLLALAALPAHAVAADLAGLEQGFVKSVAAIKPSVVTVAAPYRTPGAVEPEYVVLSGVVVRPGYIASLSNLLGQCEEVTVTYADGREARAKVAGYDPMYGLGLVKVDRQDLRPAAIAKDPPAPGAWVVLVGNAYGLSHSVAWGVVSGLRRDVRVQGRPPVEMIQMTAPVNPGDSGCAVVNLRGELVGLASSSYCAGGRGLTGINFAVPMAALQEPIEQIVAKGRVERGWLGAAVATVYLPHGDRNAVQVIHVSPDSPAAQAGLATGDVILSVDDRPVFAMEQMEALVLQSPPDSTLSIEIVRGGVHATVQPRLGRWRSSRAHAVANVDALIHRVAPDGSVRLSGADRGPGDPRLRRRLMQMYEQIQQLLKETEP